MNKVKQMNKWMLIYYQLRNWVSKNVSFPAYNFWVLLPYLTFCFIILIFDVLANLTFCFFAFNTWTANNYILWELQMSCWFGKWFCCLVIIIRRWPMNSNQNYLNTRTTPFTFQFMRKGIVHKTVQFFLTLVR